MLYCYCWLFLLHFLISGAKSTPLKVLATTDDLTKFSGGSGAKLIHPPDIQLVDVTVCLRFYDFVLVDKYLVFSKDDDGTKMAPVFGIFEGTFPKRFLWYVLWNGVWNKMEYDFSLLTWHHICWSYFNSTSTSRMVIDGDEVLEQIDIKLTKSPMAIPKFLKKPKQPLLSFKNIICNVYFIHHRLHKTFQKV